jgi:hypothetical protein
MLSSNHTPGSSKQKYGTEFNGSQTVERSGEDRLPAVVQKQLWPVVNDLVRLSSDLTSTQGVAGLVNSAKIMFLKIPERVVTRSRHSYRRYTRYSTQPLQTGYRILLGPSGSST